MRASYARGECRLAYAFMQEAADIYSRNLRRDAEAMRYLRDRGFDDATVRCFGLGCAPRRKDAVRLTLCKGPDAVHRAKLAYQCGLLFRNDDGGYRDLMKNRVMFPIRWPDKKGKFRVIAFGGRTLCSNGGAKYLNTPTTFLYRKSSVVYGLDQAYRDILRTDTVVLVEGYTDCMAAHQANIRNVVAVSGTAFTNDHAHMLAVFASSACIVMDGDTAGRKGSSVAMQALKVAGVKSRRVTLPMNLDPADFIKARGADAFREAIR